MVYKLNILLNSNDPLPNIGDLFEIVTIEDGNFGKFDIPYVTVTLKKVNKIMDYSDPRNISDEYSWSGENK